MASWNQLKEGASGAGSMRLRSVRSKLSTKGKEKEEDPEEGKKEKKGKRRRRRRRRKRRLNQPPMRGRSKSKPGRSRRRRRKRKRRRAREREEKEREQEKEKEKEKKGRKLKKERSRKFGKDKEKEKESVRKVVRHTPLSEVFPAGYADEPECPQLARATSQRSMRGRAPPVEEAMDQLLRDDDAEDRDTTMSTPVKKPRLRPVSEQMLTRGRPKACEGEDGNLFFFSVPFRSKLTFIILQLSCQSWMRLQMT